MAKGKWVAYSNVIGDKKMYIAGRILDTSKPLHGGNIEHNGGYSADREVVLKHCGELNKGGEL